MSRMWQRISRIDHLPGAGVKSRTFFDSPLRDAFRACGVAARVSKKRRRSKSSMGSSSAGTHAVERFVELGEQELLRPEPREQGVEDVRGPFGAARGIERDVRHTPHGERLLDR